MISYASNFEDVVLARVLNDKTDGFFIDIGANHPEIGSVTKHFSDLGWRGINVEPDTLMLDILKKQRPRDINLSVGISRVCSEKTFYQVFQNNGLSTFDPKVAKRLKEQGFDMLEKKLETISLAELAKQHIGKRLVDFLKIDVEGHEHEVIAGADFTCLRPRILVIEATIPSSNILNHESWESILLNAGYHFVLFDGINRFYVRDEDFSITTKLCYPANFLDGFISIREKNLKLACEEFLHFGRPARMAARIVQRCSNSVKSVLRLSGWNC